MFKRILQKARPRKLFLYYVIQKFLRNKFFIDVIDFGCGDGALRKIINYKNYYGIDIDYKTIEKNKKNLDKHDNFFLGNIKDFIIKKKYDLVLCTQLLGFNKNFNHSELDNIISQLNNSTKTNGFLIFNTGNKIAFETENIEKKILFNFNIINKITYGNFKIKRNILIAKFILFLQIYFVFFRKGVTENVLYICKKK